METLADLAGSRWSGRAELWLDPLGNDADLSDCTIAVEERNIRYTWSREGKPQQGTLELTDAGAEFHDTFHATDPMQFRHAEGLPSLLHLTGTYMVEWGWRISLCLRAPSGELVLQMTNVTPWGEEARAVRMVCKRDEA